MGRFTPRVAIVADDHGTWYAEGFPGLYHAERAWKKLSPLHASVLFLETSSGGWCPLKEYGTAKAVAAIRDAFDATYRAALYPDSKPRTTTPPPPPSRRASAPTAESAPEKAAAPMNRRSSYNDAPEGAVDISREAAPPPPAPYAAPKVTTPTLRRSNIFQKEELPPKPYAAPPAAAPTLRRSSIRQGDDAAAPTAAAAPEAAPTNRRSSDNRDVPVDELAAVDVSCEAAPAPYLAPKVTAPTLRRSNIFRNESAADSYAGAPATAPTLRRLIPPLADDAEPSTLKARRASEPTPSPSYRSQETNKPTLRRSSYNPVVPIEIPADILADADEDVPPDPAA